MCGIAGVLAAEGRASRGLEEVRRMAAALDRRGPDGRHVVAFDGAVLGHARLAIIDLETGDQPQATEDGRVVVVVNGEIYNYVELREELLGRGRRFATKSDVEVIPHLYSEHGLAFVEKLRGMFAIALWDRDRRRLVLVRDRLGKKPLYWTRTDEGFWFGSELKALFAVDHLRFDLDHEAIEEYLTYQYVPAPRTVVRQANKLRAAGMLIVDQAPDGGLTIEEREWWRVPADVLSSIGREEALEALAERFDRAVRIRLRSDVPLGAFLSSGIDSTLVAATAAPMVSEGLRTTTVAFEGGNADEVRLAADVARRLGTRHEVREIKADAAALLDEVTGYLDEPLGDSSALPTFLVSRAAREGVKVAVSGDGGDESFAGYAWRYWQNLRLDALRRRIPFSGAFRMLAAIYPKADRLPKPLRWKWALRNLGSDAFEAYFLDMSVLRPEDKAALYREEHARRLGDHDVRAVLRRHHDRARDEGRDLLGRMLYVDLKTYLAEGVLAKVDRMSMANGLEVRSPLLDHEVVELAFRLPAGLKMEGRRGKAILRELARRRVGPEVASAPKSGFAPPLSRWLRGELREVLRERLLSNEGLVAEIARPEAVASMIDRHVAGARDHARPLWLLLCLESWWRRWGARIGPR